MAAKKKQEWWRKYSYTPMDFSRRFLLFIVLSYVAITYRGLIIAATVNGEPISRFAIISELEKQGGGQTLETLVNEVLIKQKAKEAHVNVSADDIAARISEIESQFVAEGQSFEDLLVLQGMTLKQLEEQIETQIIVEKLLEGDVTVTDEEVTAYIEENKEFLPADLSEEELKTTVRDQLKQQQISSRFASWMAELRSEANITQYVDY